MGRATDGEYHAGGLRAKYPPEDREEYDRAYAAAALAGELAELVYNLRDRGGLTQAELARRMGTTQSSIARIESGGSLPTVEMLPGWRGPWGSRCGWQPLASMLSSLAALPSIRCRIFPRRPSLGRDHCPCHFECPQAALSLSARRGHHSELGISFAASHKDGC